MVSRNRRPPNRDLLSTAFHKQLFWTPHGKKIDYVRQIAKVEGVPLEQFRQYLANKPFSDARCGEYSMEISQILSLLPPPPVKLLDVGVGSEWTGELFALRGYEVLGLDISRDMIDLANMRSGEAKFLVLDYGFYPILGGFDVTVIYDALHHVDDELSVMRSIFNALSDEGILINIEPGTGHSTTVDNLEVMRKYGTTEKNMPYAHQKKLMHKVGFGVVEQYTRVSQVPLEGVSKLNVSVKQVRRGLALGYGFATGLTSVVLGRKTGSAVNEHDPKVASIILSLSVAHDKFLQASNIRTD